MRVPVVGTGERDRSLCAPIAVPPRLDAPLRPAGHRSNRGAVSGRTDHDSPWSSEAIRLRIASDPCDRAAVANCIRAADVDAEVFRWFRRFLVLPGTLILEDLLVTDGDVLRKALAAGRGADPTLLRRWAGSVKFRHRTIPAVVGACLLLRGRIEPDEPLAAPLAEPDNYDRLVAALTFDALSSAAVPAAVPDAFDLILANRYVASMLLRAGYVEMSAQVGRAVSVFQHRCRRHFHGTETRVLTNNWIATIGHMVVLAFLVKGQNAGLFDYGGTRIWKGGIANRYLLKLIYLKSRNVDFVDRWSTFAENHGSQNLEDIDGQIVDCFAACGVVADRAGDVRGAILPRPGRDLPALARFFRSVRPGSVGSTRHPALPGFRLPARRLPRPAEHRHHNLSAGDCIAGALRLPGDPAWRWLDAANAGDRRRLRLRPVGAQIRGTGHPVAGRIGVPHRLKLRAVPGSAVVRNALPVPELAPVRAAALGTPELDRPEADQGSLRPPAGPRP